MSKIQWCDKTWNPIIGCTKVSAGCDNCYAEKMAGRLSNISTTHYDYMEVVKSAQFKLHYRGFQEWNGKTFIRKQELQKPSHWKKPVKIFVCSMSDLFHEATSFEWILQVWDMMCSNPRHTYQILTKRPERVIEFLKWLGNKAKDDGLDSIPSQSDNPLDYISIPDFIWIGVTVENQAMANRRLPVLIEIPSKVKFASCEPLLESIDISIWLHSGFMEPPFDDRVNWVIAGPETGVKKRFFDKDWVNMLYYQCKNANVPFFDKKDTLGLNVKQFPKT
jgi:protein gp37